MISYPGPDHFYRLWAEVMCLRSHLLIKLNILADLREIVVLKDGFRLI